MPTKKRFVFSSLLGLVASFFAVSDAGGNAFRDSAPRLALAFDSGNELAHRAVAEQMLARSSDAIGLQAAQGHVKAALVKAPGLGNMLRSYAMLAEADLERGDPDAIMRMAGRFSQRDLLTQIWLIEKYAQADDLELTLKHYDAILRTNRDARKALFPLLARGLGDTELRPSIVEMLSEDPHWSESFYNFAAADPNYARFIPAVIASLGADKARVSASAYEKAAETLFMNGNIELAEQLAVPKSARRNIGDFANTSRSLAPFAWKIQPSGTVAVSAADEGGLDIGIGIGPGGVIGERAIRLIDGQLALDGLMVSNETNIDLLPRLKLKCASGAGDELIVRPERIDTKRLRFTVRANFEGCRYGYLSVLAPSNFAGQLVRAEIISLRLVASNADAVTLQSTNHNKRSQRKFVSGPYATWNERLRIGA